MTGVTELVMTEQKFKSPRLILRNSRMAFGFKILQGFVFKFSSLRGKFDWFVGEIYLIILFKFDL